MPRRSESLQANLPIEHFSKFKMESKAMNPLVHSDFPQSIFKVSLSTIQFILPIMCQEILTQPI